MSKVWLITGASSGFGAALAQAAILRGDKVAATFRSQEQATAFSLAHNGSGEGFVLDVNNEAQTAAAPQAAHSLFGSIDVLVNNAGYGLIGSVEECSMGEIRVQMETNFFGAMAVTKAVLPIMRQQKSGHIIQISSAAGFKATGGFGVYNASKFALEGFSEALAQEVQPFGIQVVIAQLGPFRTQFAGTSVRLAANRITEYESTPVKQMYHYIQRIDGRQEGDPVKGAAAICDYVHNGNKELRLPLGKHSVQVIRAKLLSVQKEVDANEAIAMSTMYP